MAAELANAAPQLVDLMRQQLSLLLSGAVGSFTVELVQSNRYVQATVCHGRPNHYRLLEVSRAEDAARHLAAAAALVLGVSGAGELWVSHGGDSSPTTA